MQAINITRARDVAESCHLGRTFFAPEVRPMWSSEVSSSECDNDVVGETPSSRDSQWKSRTSQPVPVSAAELVLRASCTSANKSSVVEPISEPIGSSPTRPQFGDSWRDRYRSWRLETIGRRAISAIEESKLRIVQRLPAIEESGETSTSHSASRRALPLSPCPSPQSTERRRLVAPLGMPICCPPAPPFSRAAALVSQRMDLINGTSLGPTLHVRHYAAGSTAHRPALAVGLASLAVDVATASELTSSDLEAHAAGDLEGQTQIFEKDKDSSPVEIMTRKLSSQLKTSPSRCEVHEKSTSVFDVSAHGGSVMTMSMSMSTGAENLGDRGTNHVRGE